MQDDAISYKGWVVRQAVKGKQSARKLSNEVAQCAVAMMRTVAHSSRAKLIKLVELAYVGYN